MDVDDRRKQERDMQDYWDEKLKHTPWPAHVSGMCELGNHKPCTGVIQPERTTCECWCHEKAKAA